MKRLDDGIGRRRLPMFVINYVARQTSFKLKLNLTLVSWWRYLVTESILESRQFAAISSWLRIHFLSLSVNKLAQYNRVPVIFS